MAEIDKNFEEDVKPIVAVRDLDGKINTLHYDESIRFSNSYLAGLDGDYDGDQITAKILWTQEANEECEQGMNSKSFFLNTNGKNMRTIDLEAIQTFYVLTKDKTS